MDFDLELSIQALVRTPGALHALLDGLPAAWTRGVEGPETFSPFDVVGHLIDGEETDWIPRAKIILARGPDVRFEPYDRFRHWRRCLQQRSQRITRWMRFASAWRRASGRGSQWALPKRSVMTAA